MVRGGIIQCPMTDKKQNMCDLNINTDVIAENKEYWASYPKTTGFVESLRHRESIFWCMKCQNILHYSHYRYIFYKKRFIPANAICFATRGLSKTFYAVTGTFFTSKPASSLLPLL